MARSFCFLLIFILLIFPNQMVLGFVPLGYLELVADSITIVTGVIKLGNQLWTELHKSWRLMNGQPVHTVRENNASQNLLLAELKHLATADQLKVDLENVRDEVTSKVTDTVPGLVELNRRLSIIFVNSLNVGKSYDNFLQYVEKPEDFDPKILKNFALKTISEDSCGLNYLLEEIHTLLTKSDFTTPSVIHLLMRHMELFLESTKVLKSPQQLFHNILTSIIYTEIKGFLTMRYSYQLLTLYEGGRYEGHIKKTEHDFSHRINETMSTFKTVMDSASREVWKDDPQQYVHGVTFTELKSVFQQYVINERDISKDDNCAHTCSKYEIPTEKVADNCYYKDICAHQRICEGYLFSCRSKSQELKICPSDKNNTRRYQYIEDQTDGHRYGLKEEKCSTDLIRAEYHTIVFKARRCDPCLCVCADTSIKSERYFSLDPSMAKYEDNYVITGVRLVKQNSTVHIQIQEGLLLPNGNINQSTVTWLPIKDKPENIFTLEYDRSRGINLDDLEVPKNHVLIGLSFSSENFEGSDRLLYKRLHLKIFSTSLNFTSGKLLTDPSYHKESISKSSKDEVDLNDLDIPTRNVVKGSSIKSRPSQYLKFETTGLEQDVGQSTIPFIDMQNITTDPASPMGGAGLYHRKKTGKGGFVAMKLFTYDVSHHLEANLPKEYKELENKIESP